ncbi:DUF4304 domain-containing protein [Pseudomonas sp. B22129]|uniref:DUF4304 domain-containing protein n=1 Tax=Pseudomonas sp. B22129 TaxID=3235111 RepID=UPI003784DA88
MEREKIDAALKEHVIPILRSMGFKGSPPHFRCNTGQQIDLITFQFDNRDCLSTGRGDREAHPMTPKFGRVAETARNDAETIRRLTESIARGQKHKSPAIAGLSFESWRETRPPKAFHLNILC